MPLKRPQKRRQDDEDEASSRHAKKPGKNKREVTYDTYDEALDGGVEMEEKGERYRDGDKAQRFYEKALDLYKTAYDFNPTFDAAYNQARVLFALSTSFFSPPVSVSYLTTSIDLYRHAVTLTNDTVLQLDAAYNLAQALIELAEVLEDLHPERLEQIRKVRLEGKEILDGVLTGQEEYVKSTAEDVEIDQASEAVDDVEPGAEEDEGMEVEAMDTAQTTTYETHVPTPSAMVDTALLLVDLQLTIWTAVEPPTLPDTVEQQSARATLDRVSAIVPVGRQAEIDLAEIKVLLAMDEIVWEVYKAEARVDAGIEKSLEGAVGALTTLLTSLDVHPPEEPTLRAEILTILADTHLTTTFRLLHLAPQLPPGPSPLAQGAWYNLSQAVTHLTAALELPTNANTPKTFKASVLLSLSKVSLARARLGNINETAKRNAQQLVENASTYAGRSLDALGWGYLGGGTAGSPPWSSGWDTEWLARSVMLQHLRIGHIVSSSDILPEAKVAFAENAQNLLAKLNKISPDERKIKTSDIARFVEMIEDEEQGVSEAEATWWQGIAAVLDA